MDSNTRSNPRQIQLHCHTDTCLKKMLVARVVALKLDPTPFSSKERLRSEGLLDWDKLLRSPTEFLPLRKTTVILTCWNTHQLLLSPAILVNAIFPPQGSTFLNCHPSPSPPKSLILLLEHEDTSGYKSFLLENKAGQMSPCKSLELNQGLLIGC